MEAAARKDGEKLTVIVEGKIGTTTAPEFEKVIKDNIGGVTELVIDFEKVEYMASAGLRILLSTAKVMQKQGSMRIINVTPAVMKVFTFSGMADLLDIEAV